jgi:DNA-binding XRE family transcriptional regulator
MIGKKLYLFGGYSKEPFNDTRIMINCEEHWFSELFENRGEEGIDYPQKRFGHSLNVYRQSLVLFGGGTSYNPNVKLRLTMNDVKTFDTSKVSLHVNNL